LIFFFSTLLNKHLASTALVLAHCSRWDQAKSVRGSTQFTCHAHNQTFSTSTGIVRVERKSQFFRGKNAPFTRGEKMLIATVSVQAPEENALIFVTAVRPACDS